MGADNAELVDPIAKFRRQVDEGRSLHVFSILDVRTPAGTATMLSTKSAARTEIVGVLSIAMQGTVLNV